MAHPTPSRAGRSVTVISGVLFLLAFAALLVWEARP